MSFHSLPVAWVLEKSDVIPTFFLLYVGKVFSSSGCFQDFPLPFDFCSLKMICLGVVFLVLTCLVFSELPVSVLWSLTLL